MGRLASGWTPKKERSGGQQLWRGRRMGATHLRQRVVFNRCQGAARAGNESGLGQAGCGTASMGVGGAAAA